jgi:hypothetical protein
MLAVVTDYGVSPVPKRFADWIREKHPAHDEYLLADGNMRRRKAYRQWRRDMTRIETALSLEAEVDFWHGE